MTGASDDDPAGIGTYVQAGAQLGLLQLWTPLFSFPAMAAAQEMCGRIGVVTGQGLAAVIRKHYAWPVLWFIVTLQVATNTINIGADLSAMAESTRLLWHVPYFAVLAFTTLATALLMILVPYRTYASYLKFLGLSLFTYVVAVFTIHVDWKQVVISTLLPHIEFNRSFILTTFAVFGVTISPYAFFWQANEEVEELVDSRTIASEGAARPPLKADDLQSLRIDTLSGMFFSNVIMYFIILVAAATLHAHGYTDVQSAAQAAQVLRPLAGPLTGVLFVTGILSAGLLSIPIMACSSAYAIGGAFGWPRSLSRPFWEEWRFYGIIAASCAIGLLVNLSHVPPFKMLYYSSVLNGIITPPMVLVVTHIAGNPKIMGEHANSPFSNVVGWSLSALMALALIALVV